MEISGRTVLVTGAASGIGRALARGFHADGARVLAVDVDADGLAALADEGLATHRADVADPADVRAAVAAAVDAGGRLDVIVNNAGVADRHRIEELPEGVYERVLAVNLFGALYGMRAAMPVMRRQGSGRIINTLSRHAETGWSATAAYGSSKAALFALTRVAASEAADADILVNGLIPGPTATGMNPRRPGLQEPEVVYPTARLLATLPPGGPSGRVFWNEREYRLFDPATEVYALSERELRARRALAIARKPPTA